MEKVVLIDCDGLLYKDMEDLDEYKDRIDKIISDVILSCGASHYKCFIEMKGNQTFRKVLSKTYKAKRKLKKLHNMNEIRDYIIECYDPFISCGVESDDSITSTWKYLEEEYPLTEVFIAGNDKDYLTYPINYIDLYYGRYLARETISEADANYNFAYQMIRGDVSDCVEGIKGIGDKGAKKHLDKTNGTYLGYTKLILSLYKDYYKSYKKAKEKIKETYMMLRLKTDVKVAKDFIEVEYE